MYGFKIKPLEWEGDFAHTGLGLFYHIDRRTGNALYRITNSATTGLAAGLTDEEYHGIAQADFDSKVRGALEPSPITPAEHLAPVRSAAGAEVQAGGLSLSDSSPPAASITPVEAAEVLLGTELPFAGAQDMPDIVEDWLRAIAAQGQESNQ